MSIFIQIFHFNHNWTSHFHLCVETNWNFASNHPTPSCTDRLFYVIVHAGFFSFIQCTLRLFIFPHVQIINILSVSWLLDHLVHLDDASAGLYLAPSRFFMLVLIFVCLQYVYVSGKFYLLQALVFSMHLLKNFSSFFLVCYYKQ